MQSIFRPAALKTRFGIVQFLFSGMKNLLTWENKNVQAWFRYRCRHPRKNMTFCLACRCGSGPGVSGTARIVVGEGIISDTEQFYVD